MSSQKITGDTRYRSVIVEDFRSFATVGEFEEDEENAQIHEGCQVLSEEIKLSKVEPDVVVASYSAADTQAAVAETSADVDLRKKQLLERFEREKQLILDELQREEMVTADYQNFDQLHRAKGLGCLNRNQELPSPNDQQGVEPLLESSLPHEEVLEESHPEYKSQSGIPAPSSENRPQVNEFSLLSHYLPAALCDRGISTESEVDRLSRQLQVLVHQLAGCRQNLLRAEIEVGVLHEENRELRCLIKDLLAAYPRP